jgi:hypothetical protein
VVCKIGGTGACIGGGGLGGGRRREAGFKVGFEDPDEETTADCYEGLVTALLVF